MAINARFGGAAHDSFVWDSSAEKQWFESNYTAGKKLWLLGDSGYPLQPWLMTPYRSPEEGSLEAKFNDAHSAARSVIERCIGKFRQTLKI